MCKMEHIEVVGTRAEKINNITGARLLGMDSLGNCILNPTMGGATIQLVCFTSTVLAVYLA